MRVMKTDAYRDWIDNLKDQAGRARILMRVDRLVHGNPGDQRNLTKGGSELRIDAGPGYRVYSSKRGSRILLPVADALRAAGEMCSPRSAEAGSCCCSQAEDVAEAIRLAIKYAE